MAVALESPSLSDAQFATPVIERAHAEAFRHYAEQPGNDPEALAAVLERRPAPFTEPQLAAVACPVLVVLGDRDFAAPGDRLAAALPDARLVSLRNVDHFATPESFAFIDAMMTGI